MRQRNKGHLKELPTREDHTGLGATCGVIQHSGLKGGESGVEGKCTKNEVHKREISMTAGKL